MIIHIWATLDGFPGGLAHWYIGFYLFNNVFSKGIPRIRQVQTNPGRFGPIPVRSGRFGPGRFGPISGVSRFGPVGASRSGPVS